MSERYKFFHWNCPECGAFGGMNLPDSTPEDDVLLRAVAKHRDDQVETVFEQRCSTIAVHLEP